jgi:hypothetical protein
MTSYKQIEANRRNALRSTGPKTESGKHISRCNALRHGLTAETVIRTLEDVEDYKAFEAAITAVTLVADTNFRRSRTNELLHPRHAGLAVIRHGR